MQTDIKHADPPTAAEITFKNISLKRKYGVIFKNGISEFPTPNYLMKNSRGSSQETYGIPYQGSKSGIATKIVDLLPSANVLVDLFAGGCALTHAALLSNKWEKIITNDISEMPNLFRDAMNGKYENEKRWISKEDFFALKDEDPYVRSCWSFGSDLCTYLYGQDVAPFKKAGHYAIMFDDWHELHKISPEICKVVRNALKGIKNINTRRLSYDFAINKCLENIKAQLNIDPENIKMLENLGRLQNLSNLSRLVRLQNLKKIKTSVKFEISRNDYRDVRIPSDSVVYCDPPYITEHSKKNQYNTEFDQDAFLEWCRTRDFPVFISEYSLPEDFIPIAKWKKVNSFCSTRNFVNIERVFVHEKFYNLICKNKTWLI